ncbi:hypothetical protein OIO90_002921 [Microbotryomycetes sp. JL221]|nr:hypothetical protein OIO90_002921 [Microbotryomycetes sp. JL221]
MATQAHKCDGPSQIPCRRCQLYNIPCEYPPPNNGGAGKAPSNHHKPASTSSSNGSTTNTSAAPPLYPSFAPAEVMSDKLDEISKRLKSIEASLAQVQLSSPASNLPLRPFVGSPPSAVSGNGGGRQASESESSLSHIDEPTQIVMSVGAGNALQTVSESIVLLDAFEQENSPRDSSDVVGPSTNQTTKNSNGGANAGSQMQQTFISNLFSGMTAPDAIVRGIMTAEECETSFKIFFRLIEPWFVLLDVQRDIDAMAVRERSPLLFHAILLTTAYYLMDTSQRGATVYHSLMTLVNEILAPIIISTQSFHLKTDMVRALVLMLLYKPVQFAALHSAEIVDPEQAEQMCKLSPTSSSTLWGVILRTAHTIGLHGAPNAFARIYSPSIKPPPEVLGNLRCWMWTCVVDTHGALTTSRIGVIDLSDSLKVTRMFASLKAQPGDTRIAAHVELYGCAKVVLSSSWFLAPPSKPISEHDLKKFNRSLDDWEEYWSVQLKEAAEEGDALAPTVISTWRNLVQIIVNSVVFTRWRATRKANLLNNVPGHPHLSSTEWSFLQQLVDALERLVFSLSQESRSNDTPLRKVQWPARQSNGMRPRLTVDKTVIEMYRTSYDPVSCVGFIYPLILVTKMANAGLTICELECSPKIWEMFTPGQPKKLVPGSKLHRLLDLGADFLEAIAPTRTHPARKHSRMLRTILAAGLLGQTPGSRSSTSPASDRTLAGSNQSFAQSDTRNNNNSGSVQNTQSNNDAVRHTNATLPTISTAMSMTLPPLSAPVSAVSSTTAQAPVVSALSPTALSSSAGAGETLESILQGISPSYFGAPGLFDTDMGFDPTSLETMDMNIDWESIERGIQQQQQQQQQQTSAPSALTDRDTSFPFGTSFSVDLSGQQHTGFPFPEQQS